HQLDVYAVALLKTASIPKTSSGKIQRIACRTAFLAGTLDVIGDWSKIPSQKKDFIKLESDVNYLLEKVKTFSHLSESSEYKAIYEEIEQWLIAKFAELKETADENIDVRQNIGFDSLVAAELNNLFNTNWGVEIPIDNFIEGVSVNGLTAILTNKISENRWKFTEQIDQMNDDEVDTLLSSILSK
ncbi:MAG: phosphopantetheine-binding protein, partial [Snowella sp.]|nr:phosphopantetheine-binding protein [Snowella sp.]